MKRLRYGLLIGYVLATLLAQVGHDHGVADGDPAAEAKADACRESRSHLHDHPGTPVDLKADDCLACKFQSQERLILPVAVALARPSARVAADTAHVAPRSGPIRRASCRAPPFA